MSDDTTATLVLAALNAQQTIILAWIAAKYRRTTSNGAETSQTPQKPR